MTELLLERLDFVRYFIDLGQIICLVLTFPQKLSWLKRCVLLICFSAKDNLADKAKYYHTFTMKGVKLEIVFASRLDGMHGFFNTSLEMCQKFFYDFFQ